MGLEVLLTSVGALALTDFGALVFGLESLGLAAISVFRGAGSPPWCMKKPAEAGRGAMKLFGCQVKRDFVFPVAERMSLDVAHNVDPSGSTLPVRQVTTFFGLGDRSSSLNICPGTDLQNVSPGLHDHPFLFSVLIKR